jgi:hypothetical protein
MQDQNKYSDLLYKDADRMSSLQQSLASEKDHLLHRTLQLKYMKLLQGAWLNYKRHI